MRFYRNMIPKSKTKKVFAWLPIKVFGQYQRGYGQQGTVWLEYVRERTSEQGNKYSDLV